MSVTNSPFVLGSPAHSPEAHPPEPPDYTPADAGEEYGRSRLKNSDDAGIAQNSEAILIKAAHTGIIRVTGDSSVSGDNRIERDCTIVGDGSTLEIRGMLTPTGNARTLVNRMTSGASESLTIAAALKLNDTRTLRKTFTLGGIGGIRLAGPVENHIGTGSLTCDTRVVIDRGDNTYGGITTVAQGATLVVRRFADGGHPSSTGTSGTASSNLIVSGTLEYRSNRPSVSDRLFTVNSVHGATVTNESLSPEARIVFTNPGKLGLGATGTPRTFTLSGANRGDNRFAPALDDNDGAPVALRKTGRGRWILAGNNRHTGGTILFAGETCAAHHSCFGKGPVTVHDEAVLRLGDPGNPGAFVGPGLLLINGTIHLESTRACLNLTDASTYIFNGMLDLGGIFDDVAPGEYPIIIGGAGAGRYVDNLRNIAGYRREGHRAIFRQGKVVIEKVGGRTHLRD